MRLTDRIAQLAQFGIEYQVTKCPEIDKAVPVIARFEGDEGIEYVEQYDTLGIELKAGYQAEHPLFKMLIMEFGEERAWEKLENARGVPLHKNVLAVENHVIVDKKMGLQYSFYMPSRGYFEDKTLDLSQHTLL